MTRAEAKTIALKVVTAWWRLSFPVSGSVNGYRIMGTVTGRLVGGGVNRNGDAFAPGMVLDLSNHPEIVEMRHELNRQWPPDILTDRATAAAIQVALERYALQDADLTARLAIQPQPVLVERDDA